MLEFLCELLFEIIIEGTLELGTSKKVPVLLRIVAIAIFVMIYLFIIVILFIIAKDQFISGNIPVAVFVGLIDAVFTLLTVRMIYKKIKENRKIDNL